MKKSKSAVEHITTLWVCGKCGHEFFWASTPSRCPKCLTKRRRQKP